MTLDDAIDAHLTANAGVSAIVGTRIYFAFPPKGAALPLVIFNLVENPRANISGGEYTERPVYDIGAWVAPGSNPGTLADAITAAFTGIGGTGYELGGAGGVPIADAVRTNQRSATLDLQDGTFLVGSITTFELSTGGLT